MIYLADDKRVQGAADLGSLHVSSMKFDQQTTEETFALVLRAFQEVPVLESLNLVIANDPQEGGFHRSSQTCYCQTSIRAVPVSMIVPGPAHPQAKVDLIKEFVASGGSTDDQFAPFLSNFLLEVWPAFNDRSHLFGGTGSLTFTREALAPLLRPGTQVDLSLCVRAMFGEGEFSAAAFSESQPSSQPTRERVPS
jgi:hypothetical protein